LLHQHGRTAIIQREVIRRLESHRLPEFKSITEEQLKRIQSGCREWLRNPATTSNSRLTIPQDAVLPHAITIEIKAILTFDNVLITSAVDTETGACYTKLIGKSGEPGIFIDTTFEMISRDRQSAPVFSQKCEDMESVPEAVPTGSGFEHSSVNPVASASGTDSTVAIKPHADSSIAFESHSETEKYLLCSNGMVLGTSALEKTKSAHERRGRFFPSDDYYEVAQIFMQFPQAENDCLEVNVREAYGLTDDDASELRKKFNDLCERIDALKLYVADQSGKQIATKEIRLEDLSYFYREESERWLHVEFETPLQNREP
jgi:hypothetical protein